MSQNISWRITESAENQSLPLAPAWSSANRAGYIVGSRCRRGLQIVINTLCREAVSLEMLVEEARERAQKPWHNRLPGDDGGTRR